MATDIEELEESGLCARGRVGPVLVVVWRTPPSPSQLDQVLLPFLRQAHAAPGAALLEVVRTGQGFSAEAARRAVELAREHGKFLAARAVVVVGSGVWAEMHRMLQQVVGATLDSARGGASSGTFVEVSEASRWIAARLGAAGVAIDAQELGEAAGRMRALGHGESPPEVRRAHFAAGASPSADSSSGPSTRSNFR